MEKSNTTYGGGTLQITGRVIIVQILVLVFLCINSLLIVSFFSKVYFYTTMRYILFAVTLMSDSLILIISDALLLLNHFRMAMHVTLCILIYILLIVCIFVTPVTLTAMTLERYVAICFPLRHGELCSTRSTVHCILIIHGLSFVPMTVMLSAFFASAPLSMYSQYQLCSMDKFVFLQWQDYLKLVIYQWYFLTMSAIISFSYIKILKVARAASGEDKTSTRRGLRTVALHGFQLLLCLIQLWTPFVETAVLKINLNLFNNVRYFNYILFILAPRCLSPLIYGLRDEKVFLALKHKVAFVIYCGKN